jgi:hypothetical protein
MLSKDSMFLDKRHDANSTIKLTATRAKPIPKAHCSLLVMIEILLGSSYSLD